VKALKIKSIAFSLVVLALAVSGGVSVFAANNVQNSAQSTSAVTDAKPSVVADAKSTNAVADAKSTGAVEAAAVIKPSEPPKGDGIVVEGELPVISGLTDQTFETGLNNGIIAVATEKIKSAKKESARGVSFSYESYKSGNIISVVIFTQTTIASTKTEVDAFNFDVSLNKMININDVLGINAVPLANSFIIDTIKQDTEKYNVDFGGIYDTQNFYVENGNCVLVFDKYELASGYEGVVRLTIPIKNIKNMTLEKNEYIVWQDYYKLKMIPLRKAGEELGYTVGWDAAAQGVTITKGKYEVKLYIDQNIYQVGTGTRTLESPPSLIDGVTYVPITFFEIILGTAYTVDENERVTFSIYSNPVAHR
jgi:hypothetical protein